MSVVSRREREKLARRKSILQAAREQFYLDGYEASTIDKIAERAELSKGTIYSYFDSKEEIYVSANIDSYLELEKALSRAAALDLPPEEKLRAVYFAFVDHCLVFKEQLRLGLYFYTKAARRPVPPPLLEEIDGHTWKCLEISMQAIQEAKDQGILREDVDPTELSMISWRMSVGLLEMAIESDEEGLKMWRRLFDQAITLILRAVRREPEARAEDSASKQRVMSD